jgi:hypothetical protein
VPKVVSIARATASAEVGREKDDEIYLNRRIVGKSKKAAFLRPLKRGVGRTAPRLFKFSSFILLWCMMVKMNDLRRLGG